MSDILDLFDKGPQMFEKHCGHIWGPRIWKLTIGVSIIVLLSAGVGQFWATGKTILTDLGMFPDVKSVDLHAIPYVGDDNTVIDKEPLGKMGSGNTIIHGDVDTIINRGGTAIGDGACADSTSIAIGKNANAGICAKK